MNIWLERLVTAPDSLPPLERKGFIVRNQASALAAGVHGALALLFLLAGLPVFTVLELVTAPLFLLLIVWQWRGASRAVSVVAHLEANLHVLFLSLMLGQSTAFNLYFFTLAAIPLLMFPPREEGLRALFTSMPVTFWLVSELVVLEPSSWTTLAPEATIILHLLNVIGAFGTLVLTSLYFFLGSQRLEADLELERKKSWDLLRNVLPERIALQLRDRPGLIAEHHDAVTVLFADLSGFTGLTRNTDPRVLVGLLNEIFSAFDNHARALGVEKIKTVGDGYMAAAGLPGTSAAHADAVARLALAMGDTLRQTREKHQVDLHMRVGIHTGPVIAGVIGAQGYRFDLWGDTVNTASRMESSSEPDRVQVSAETIQALGGRFPVTPRGDVEIKGLGTMPTWWLA
jgi:adenylate cyclase